MSIYNRNEILYAKSFTTIVVYNRGKILKITQNSSTGYRDLHILLQLFLTTVVIYNALLNLYYGFKTVVVKLDHTTTPYLTTSYQP